jgi:hypothetical protein
MATYGELNPDIYYLIQVDTDSDIELVSVLFQTKETVLLRSYLPQAEDFFRFLDEPIFKLIEELDEETAEKFANLYQAPEEEQYEE